MTNDDVAALLRRLTRFRVAVVGDIILDRYIWGHATRISYEAPVPVVKVAKRNSALGGAGNVMRNLAALGIQPVAFGVLGADDDANEVRRLCRDWKIDTGGIITANDRPSTVKTRLISDNQQVARIDDESDEPITAETTDALCQAFVTMLEQDQIDAVIFEDYNKGVLAGGAAEQIMAALRDHDIPTALDPHPGNPLNTSGFTLMTPNRPEAFAMTSTYYRDSTHPITDDNALMDVGRALKKQWNPALLLITLGADGMLLLDGEQPPAHIPTVAQEVFDVSGAGDTVVATFMAALLAGASPAQSAVVANHAGGVVVGKLGTVTVTVDELLASFDPHQDTST